MGKHTAQDLSDLFAERLAAAEAGGASVDEGPAPHPQDAGAWPDLVALALELRQMPAPPPSAAFRSEGYRRLMREIGQEPSRRRRLRNILWPVAALFAGKGLKAAPAWAAVLAAAIVCLGTGGAVRASEDALPGDLLYGLKTTVEEVRLAVTSPEGDVGLHARFAERRIGEIETLVAAGRLADVPRAAAGYETHVEQALRVLATATDTDASTRDRLAAELDQMLSEQTAELDVLAGQMPAQMVPVIQQAQAVSAGAQNAIRELQAGPDTGRPTDERRATPTRETAVAPAGDTPRAEPPGPGGRATGLPAETPVLAPARPLPSGTRPPPAGDGGGEPRGIPDQPPPATPAGAGPAPTGQEPSPAASTPAPPPETRVAGTRVAPPLPGGSPPGPAPASTPQAHGDGR